MVPDLAEVATALAIAVVIVCWDCAFRRRARSPARLVSAHEPVSPTSVLAANVQGPSTIRGEPHDDLGGSQDDTGKPQGDVKTGCDDDSADSEDSDDDGSPASALRHLHRQIGEHNAARALKFA